MESRLGNHDIVKVLLVTDMDQAEKVKREDNKDTAL